MLATTILAHHDGGWTDYLLVAAPVAFFAALLWVANHRANRNLLPSANTEGQRTGSSIERTVSPVSERAERANHESERAERANHESERDDGSVR